jgi:hypothetical protein
MIKKNSFFQKKVDFKDGFKKMMGIFKYHKMLNRIIPHEISKRKVDLASRSF